MKYRVNQKNNEKLSLLGFGAMRFPMLDNGEIDVEEAVKMVRYAIDNGVNYLDTAHIYQDGQSEETLRKAMEDGYREKVFVATKLPFWIIEKAEDMQPTFDVQKNRLGVDCIDYYLAHDINDGNFERFKDFDVLGFLKEKKAEGKITNIGFSYHGKTFDLFKEIIDMFDWDFCQIQLNYMDAEYQAGVKGLKYASSKGIPVIIMEPLRGGKLTDIIPGPIQSYWDTIDIKRTPAEWALRWVANFPEVTTILSGMSRMEQVVENIKVLSDAEANSLTEKELDIIKKVADEYTKRTPYGCTSCQYCMPCKVDLDIPKMIAFRNEVSIYEAKEFVGDFVRRFVNPKPSACIACKACEEKCPQHLHISEIMAETAEMLE